MKNSSLLYVLILFLILNSCFQHSDKQDKQKENVIEVFYKNGNLHYSYEINKDSLKHGKFNAFYENGTINQELNYSNGYLAGEQFFYHENGQMAKYLVNDGFDDVIYVLKFDENGNKIKEEGLVISTNVYCPKCEENIVFKNDTVLFNTMASTPPGTSIDMKFEMVSPGGKKKSYPLELYDDNVVVFQEVFDELGEYKIKLIGTLYDDKKQIYLTDTVNKVLQVVSPLE